MKANFFEKYTDNELCNIHHDLTNYLDKPSIHQLPHKYNLGPCSIHVKAINDYINDDSPGVDNIITRITRCIRLIEINMIKRFMQNHPNLL